MFIKTEKEECIKEAEERKLIMSEEKCGECEFRYDCRFMQAAMNEVVYGS